MESLFANPAGLLLSGGAVAILVAGWNQIRGFISYVRSFAVISVTMSDGAGNAIMMYARERWKMSPFGPRTYAAWLFFVRPCRRREWVAMELVGKETKLFWKGWLPIWVSRTSRSPSKMDTTWYDHLPVQLTFLRGTLDLDQVTEDAVELYNNAFRSTNKHVEGRYRIIHVHGSGSKPANLSFAESGSSPAVNEVGHDDCISNLLPNRILKWAREDIGPDIYDAGKSLERLWLTPSCREIAKEIRIWLDSQDWHRERGVPWKRGYALYGPPGTGKTAFIRAIAEDYDLPVYAFDLVTLHNDEFQKEWSNMLSNTPCIALIEDIDSIFDKRKTVSGHMTFNCLLNGIDGVERADGLLLFVTTNKLETLDEALGGSDLHVSQLSTRPGRIDRAAKLETLPVEGRWHLANRIMSGYSEEERKDLVYASHDDTGAQFERRCIEYVLNHLNLLDEQLKDLKSAPARVKKR